MSFLFLVFHLSFHFYVNTNLNERKNLMIEERKRESDGFYFGDIGVS